MSVAMHLKCDGAAQQGGTDYGMFECNKRFGAFSEHYERRADLIDAARRDGWKIGPNGDAMCPSCGKPDARTLRYIEQFGLKPRQLEIADA